MEEEKMKKMKQYLLTLKIPDNISTKMIKYLERESINYTIYKDTLYRYNTSNGIIHKVIKQEDSWAHLHVPRHGTFEGELLSTPGICNTMQQTLAAFDFSLSN